ncbi:hypothetical protein JCGZ_03837 [Jatropha curcas]|uniref:Uncharacterized protein n=1 Tax=Jatropha curcas TaxID=180498 RepID=A0A067JA35_JATCU|nr:hypothetical protein JCGZ_03837 [Jatropha curcas]
MAQSTAKAANNHHGAFPPPNTSIVTTSHSGAFQIKAAKWQSAAKAVNNHRAAEAAKNHHSASPPPYMSKVTPIQNDAFQQSHQLAQLAAKDANNHHGTIHLPNTTKMAPYISKANKTAQFIHPNRSKNANPVQRTLALSQPDSATQ